MLELLESPGVHSNTPSQIDSLSTCSVCSFDGGTRYSLYLEPTFLYQSTKNRIDSARSLHALTRKPVEFVEGLMYRGASGDERTYFRDRPPMADVLYNEDFRLIISSFVFDGIRTTNSAVVILGWHVFTHSQKLSRIYKEQIVPLFRRLGFECKLDRMARIDFNVTSNSPSMSFVADAFYQKCVITRAAIEPRFTRGNGPLETLNIGKRSAPVLMRIYDKRLELLKNIKTEEGRKKVSFLASQFGVQNMIHLIRFEFELHLALLQDFQIWDFESLETRLSAILDFLFFDWLRFVAPNSRSHGHKDREKVVWWWSMIYSEFKKFAESLAAQQEEERLKHVATTGDQAKRRAFAWLEIAARECLRIESETSSKPVTVNDVEMLVSRLSKRLQESSFKYSDSVGERTPREIAFSYAIGEPLKEFENYG